MRLLDEQTKLLPISSEYYEALLADLEKYMQLVEHDVITIICDRLRKIGEMNPTSKKQISDLVRYYGSDMDKIKKAIAKRLKLSAEEVDLIFEQAATDSADFATALAMGRQDLIDTRRMEQLAMAAAKRYKDYLLNLPDTFAFKFGDQLLPIRKAYIALTNQATLAVQSGALDYNTAIRNTVKRLADNGLQVINWESGYHRRADSSVRMNVMEGVRQLNQGLLDEAGKKFATGYELSAHDRPAPDHADIQGKQYTIEQFEALNSGLKRPIGTLNCMHIAYPIIYGVTKPTYSEEELEEMKANSKKEYEWQGKKLDGYECTQKQRWYETEIRKGIDRENALKAAGDETGYRIEALKTSKLRSEYKAFSQHVGLSPKINRMGYGAGTPGRPGGGSSNGENNATIRNKPLFITGKDVQYNAIEMKSMTIDDCKTVDDVEKFIRDEDWFYHDIDKRADDAMTLKDVDLPVAKSIYKTLKKAYDKYPGLKGQLDTVRSKFMGNRAYASCYYGRGRGGINVNARYFSDEKKLETEYAGNVKSGFHPAGTKYDSIVMHEFGHAIDDYLSFTLHAAGMNGWKPKTVSSQLRPKVMRKLGLKVSDCVKVSLYASHDAAEFFAECFAEYMCSDDPREISKEFGKQLDEIMKGCGLI